MDIQIGRPTPPSTIARIGALYRKIYKTSDKMFREQDFELEMDQIPVLLILYYSGSSSQQAICSSLDRDKASVNRTISFLSKKDIVKVVQDANDKRKTVVELTETGIALALQADQSLQTFNNSLASKLTAEEQAQFSTIISKLMDTGTI